MSDDQYERESSYKRVAYTLYAGLMPQRQAITMIIVYCSKPQQTDAVTPTPLTHRSHTCMRALALGHDTSIRHGRQCGTTTRNKREHQRSAKANAATGAAIHRSDTTLAKARFLDSRVHTQIQQQSPIRCYNSESTRAQRPAGSVCAHAGDGRQYLAQGSSMQLNRRKQTQCACEALSTK